MEKYLKEIAKELRLIRIELQKMDNHAVENDLNADSLLGLAEKEIIAGERVTIK